MHGFDPFIVSACEFIGPQNIFGIVVANFQHTVVFPPFGLSGGDALRDLHIQLIILAGCHKVDFSVSAFADMDSVSSAAKFQIHYIFQKIQWFCGL